MKYSIDGTLVVLEQDDAGQPTLRALSQKAVKVSPELVRAVIAAHASGQIHTQATIDGHSRTISLVLDQPAGSSPRGT